MEMLQALEASRFAMFVKESGTAYTMFLAFHTVGLAFLVGISAGTALRVLGVARSLPLAPMKDFSPLMWAGFWINVVTGVVLLVLYPTKYLTDPTFYIKLTAVAIAIVLIRMLGARLFAEGASSDAAGESKKARQLAITLLLAWGVAITTGRLMAYTLPTKVATALAVLVFAVVALVVGYLAARGLAWVRSTRQGA